MGEIHIYLLSYFSPFVHLFKYTCAWYADNKIYSLLHNGSNRVDLSAQGQQHSSVCPILHCICVEMYNGLIDWFTMLFLNDIKLPRQYLICRVLTNPFKYSLLFCPQ